MRCSIQYILVQYKVLQPIFVHVRDELTYCVQGQVAPPPPITSAYMCLMDAPPLLVLYAC